MDEPCEPNPPREVDELCELPGVDLPDDVPDELEPQIRRALENGRALQDLLYEAGRRYTNAVKHQRAHEAEK